MKLFNGTPKSTDSVDLSSKVMRLIDHLQGRKNTEEHLNNLRLYFNSNITEENCLIPFNQKKKIKPQYSNVIQQSILNENTKKIITNNISNSPKNIDRNEMIEKKKYKSLNRQFPKGNQKMIYTETTRTNLYVKASSDFKTFSRCKQICDKATSGVFKHKTVGSTKSLKQATQKFSVRKPCLISPNQSSINEQFCLPDCFREERARTIDASHSVTKKSTGYYLSAKNSKDITNNPKPNKKKKLKFPQLWTSKHNESENLDEKESQLGGWSNDAMSNISENGI